MSENKVSRRAATGKAEAVRDALTDLQHAIENHAGNVPAEVCQAWEALVDELGGLPSDRESSKALSLGAARQAGLTVQRRQYGRHDRGRVPPGYAFDNLIAIGDESLAPSLYRIAGPERDTDRDIAIVREILEYLGGLLPYAVPERETGILAERRDVLEGVFEALHGYPFGEQWRAALETELEWDAEAKVHGALRASNHVNPSESTFAEPVSDEQFLVRMRMRPGGTESPPELTSERVAELRLQTALNKGGTKKTPRAVVQEFVDSLRK